MTPKTWKNPKTGDTHKQRMLDQIYLERERGMYVENKAVEALRGRKSSQR